MDNTPFQCATGPKSAEIDIAGGWGGVSGAQTELEYHWDEWLSEDYFEKLSSMGVNTVRLPIGYWSLGKNWTVGTPFESFGDAYVNSWSRVLRTVKWCEKYKLGVLIDLHGAPGSQNGTPPFTLASPLTLLLTLERPQVKHTLVSATARSVFGATRSTSSRPKPSSSGSPSSSNTLTTSLASSFLTNPSTATTS